MDDCNNSKRAHETGCSHLFIFVCFALLHFEVGELAHECVPTWPSGQKLEDRFGALWFFCLIGN